MVVNSSSDTKWADDNDIRLTRFGKFLRSTSKEKKSLLLNTIKIQKRYNLENIMTKDEVLDRTISWYEKYHKQKIDMRKLVEDDFRFFIKKNYE